MPAKFLELQHTIHLIREFDAEISEIETALKQMMDRIASPILTIPGISYRMGAMILAEIGDFPASIPQIKSSPMPVFLLSLTSRANWTTPMLTWRNATPVTFATRSSPPQSTYAIGALPFPLIWQKRGPKESITTSPSLTPPRSWCASSLPYNAPANLTALRPNPAILFGAERLYIYRADTAYP